MKKILFVLTNHDKLGTTGEHTGCYFPEVIIPYDILSYEGFEIDFVSPKGGEVPLIGIDETDKLTKTYLDNAEFMRKMQTTLQPKNIHPKEYDAIFFAGGHGTMWDFPNNEELQRITAQIYENDGVVAAVCHGPAGIVNVKLSNGEYLVKGKRVAAYTNEAEAAKGLIDKLPLLLESTLIERGAKYTKASGRNPNLEIDGNLVTGQNPASAEGVALGILDRLSVKA